VPLVVALLIAVAVSAALLSFGASRGRVGDLAEVRGAPAEIGAAAARHPRLRRFLLERRDPTTETGVLLTIAVGLVAGAILVTGVLLEMVDTNSGLARWDDAAARYGALHATPETTRLLEAITQLGSTVPVLILVATVGVVELWRHRRMTILAFLLVTVFSTMAVYNATKLIVNRPRPDISQLVGATGSSFPSGHSATAAAAYAALALVLGRGMGRRGRVVLAAVAGAITAAVAASRILLGVHWLTDVIAGISVGWGCFAVCSIAFGGRVLHFGRPVELAEQAADGVERQQGIIR